MELITNKDKIKAKPALVALGVLIRLELRIETITLIAKF